jgi:type IV secretion system protein VirB6
MNADCREGKRSYSPICGRYSIYSGSYVSNCQWVNDCYDCNCERKCVTAGAHLPWFFGAFGECAGDVIIKCDRCGCWQNVTSQAPEPFKYDGTYTNPWSDNLANLFTNFNPQCSDTNYVEKDKDYIMGAYQNKRHFWYSATTATGLLYRLDSSEVPTNAKARGTGYSFAKVSTDQADYNNNPNFNIIYNTTYGSGDKTYLQYRFHDEDNQFADNTGGYVLSIKQTKCRRTDGAVLNDVVSSRGKVEYMIVPVGQDANDPTNSYFKATVSISATGDGNITAGNEPGNIWMRIYNDPNDYKDSTGQYIVQFFTSQSVGSFTLQILDPLFETLKGKVKTASQTIFKNMTCYQAGADTSASCVNFFNYIKGMLTLYIMIYGALFLLGIVQISQLDLVIRVIKIAIVAGLMNERTFDLFNNYVFDFVTGFSDQIISNMAGYSLFTSTGTITNPFTFLDALMSKILFSKTFMGQLLALIAMGMSGILYFIIIFIALIIVIITALRAVAVYLMAFMAIAVLIGLAPLFLTFMLFEFTKYLFDNWVKFTFRYMLEPTVLMAGIIILTQLFTIYLDFAVGYSVCWKCALPIKIPFPAIPGLDFAFTNVELFCINWFAPWGYDHRTGMMGMNMQHLIALMMIAYCMYGYTELSGKMVTKLTSGIGGPSATQMGKTMSSSMGNKAMSSMGLSKENREKITGGMKERGTQKLAEGMAKMKRSQGNSKPSSSGAGKPEEGSAPKPPASGGGVSK